MRAAVLGAVLALLSAPASACDFPGGPPGAEEVTAEGEGVVWACHSNGVIEGAILADDTDRETMAASLSCGDAG
ncbi:MAG TPA: hypothetical protein VMM55_03900 [Thermohalobaculum sp.]|nr:hypothetical protein [Thermohalobaculum sp.]